MRGHREAAAVLLEHGADPRLKCLRGHTVRQRTGRREKNKDAKFVAQLDAAAAATAAASSPTPGGTSSGSSPNASPPARGGATARAIPTAIPVSSPSLLRASRSGPSRPSRDF